MSRIGIMGCDPGLSGAVAALWVEDNQVVSVRVDDMPLVAQKSGGRSQKTINEAALAGLIRDYESVYAAMVEIVGAMPGQGVTSMFRFGEAYGLLRGVLAACQIPTHRVTPVAWKTAVNLVGQDKDASRLAASRLFPAYAGLFAKAKDNGRADALLMAWYGYLNFRAGKI